MAGDLEHMTYEDRQEELGLFSPEKRGWRGGYLVTDFIYEKAGMKMRMINFAQRPQGKRECTSVITQGILVRIC